MESLNTGFLAIKRLLSRLVHAGNQGAKAACSLTRLCISTLGSTPGLIRHAEQMFVVFGDAAAEKAKKHQASWIRESVSQI